MMATLYKYRSTALPRLDLTALATTVRKVLDLLAYFSRMRRYGFHFYPSFLSDYLLELSVLPNQLIFSRRR
jgi:hypothetical protein